MPDDAFLEDSPYSATFIVEVDGQAVGRFTRASGLELTVAVEEIAEGGQNGFVHKLPGRMSWPNIVLTRGVTQNDRFFSWVSESSGEGFSSNRNTLTRSSVAITMTNTQGKRLRTWELEGAFPVRWKGPEFASDSSDPLVEELEIAHHGFRSSTLV
ncbi:MAG: phage tail protein [Acidimicrobiales bacterium]